jgi:hypothetical protein
LRNIIAERELVAEGLGICAHREVKMKVGGWGRLVVGVDLELMKRKQRSVHESQANAKSSQRRVKPQQSRAPVVRPETFF